MQPLGLPQSDAEGVPNLELLRRSGWSVNTVSGAYCSAWRGRDEVVFQWRGGEWQPLGGRSSAEAA